MQIAFDSETRYRKKQIPLEDNIAFDERQKPERPVSCEEEIVLRDVQSIA